MKFILAAALAVQAVHAQEAVFNPELSLILEAGADNLGKKSPYLVRYAKGDRLLSFVAAKHGNKTKNAGTFALVESEFKALGPDIVIIEGVFTACLACPPNCAAAFGAGTQGPFEKSECGDRVSRVDSQSGLTEAYYAANLAYYNDPRIPFIGGEILNADLKAHILKGFQADKFKQFYILRALGGAKQDGADCTVDSVKKISAEALKKFNLEFSESQTITVQEVAYFQRACKNSQWAVQPNAKGTFSQKISAASSRVRDQHLAQVIANMLKGYKKVLVVYGGGHYDTLYKVLDGMLGTPTFPE